jgi:hypothetical protein
MPGHRHLPHQQRAVEHGGAGREPLDVVEERRARPQHAHGLDAPCVRPQLQPFQRGAARRGRVAERAALEEAGCRLEVVEEAALQLASDLRGDIDPGRCVEALEGHPNPVLPLVGGEAGSVVFSREKPAADDDVDQRGGVPSRDVHAGRHAVRGVPRNRHAVRGVLAPPADPRRRPTGTEVAQPDEADAGHREAAVELRAEGCREQRRHHVRVDAVVHEQSPLDLAVQLRGPHVEALRRDRR